MADWLTDLLIALLIDGIIRECATKPESEDSHQARKGKPLPSQQDKAAIRAARETNHKASKGKQPPREELAPPVKVISIRTRGFLLGEALRPSLETAKCPCQSED